MVHKIFLLDLQVKTEQIEELYFYTDSPVFNSFQIIAAFIPIKTILIIKLSVLFNY